MSHVYMEVRVGLRIAERAWTVWWASVTHVARWWRRSAAQGAGTRLGHRFEPLHCGSPHRSYGEDGWTVGACVWGIVTKGARSPPWWRTPPGRLSQPGGVRLVAYKVHMEITNNSEQTNASLWPMQAPRSPWGADVGCCALLVHGLAELRWLWAPVYAQYIIVAIGTPLCSVDLGLG